MIEGGGVPKNMGAISGGLEKIWNKKQFLFHSPLQLKLWLVPNFEKSQDTLQKLRPRNFPEKKRYFLSV